MKDYYYILGVGEVADKEAIKAAYRKLSKKFHPDVNEGDKYFEERFKEIQEAYEILSDDKERRNYDLKRKEKRTFTEDTTNQTHEYKSNSYPSENNENKQIRHTYFGGGFVFLALIVVIGIIVIVVNNSKTEHNINHNPSISKQNDICECNLNFITNKIKFNKNEYNMSQVKIGIEMNTDFDTLFGNVDSIIENEFEKKIRFDEEVAEIVNTTRYHYKNNKLVDVSAYDKHDLFFNKKNILIYDGMLLVKRIVIVSSEDSTTFKYEYGNCSNKNLSSIKVYDKDGGKIAKCDINYNKDLGTISINAVGYYVCS